MNVFFSGKELLRATIEHVYIQTITIEVKSSKDLSLSESIPAPSLHCATDGIIMLNATSIISTVHNYQD
jgi:hypothetical protein